MDFQEVAHGNYQSNESTYTRLEIQTRYLNFWQDCVPFVKDITCWDGI